MSVIKSLILAFSMYSRIPVPHVRLEEKDMKYTFGFFPLVGVVIGALFSGWLIFARKFCIGTITSMCVSGVFLLLITGGIHIDGYMDTMDAVHSYGNREKKLAILKDSHIGAFAVIMLVTYVLAAAGAFSYIFENKNTDIFIIMGCVFYLSRISSAFAAVNFKSARNGGMLNSVVRSVSGHVVNIMILLNYIICIAIMTYVNAFAAALCLIVQAAVLVYYRIWSYKIFGGVTGDLAGWFLCMSELCCMIVLAFV